DSDAGELVFKRHQEHAGVIFLRLGPATATKFRIEFEWCSKPTRMSWTNSWSLRRVACVSGAGAHRNQPPGALCEAGCGAWGGGSGAASTRSARTIRRLSYSRVLGLKVPWQVMRVMTSRPAGPTTSSTDSESPVAEL